MKDKQLKHNSDCQSQNHDEHLCFLMYEGFHFKHPEEYKKIVQNAEYRCQNCGRTANKNSQLCNPFTL